MHWDLMCYDRVDAHAQLEPVKELLPELPTGATLLAWKLTERMRLACDNSMRRRPVAQRFARNVAKRCQWKMRTRT